VPSDYDCLRDEPTARALEQRAARKARETNAGRFVIFSAHRHLTVVDATDESKAVRVSHHTVR